MSEYRFFLYHKDIAKWVRIKDPIGWDGLGKTIRRFGMDTAVGSPWHGIFFQYDVKLEFVKNGKNFIQKFFGLYGIEQDILLRIEKRNALNREFHTHYEGRLNLSTYKVKTISVSCNVEQTGFIQKLKNRADTKVSMEATETLGGKSVTPPASESIVMHSKIIRKEDALQPEGGIQSTTQNSVAPGTYYLMGGLSQKFGELSQFFNYDVGLSTLDPTGVDKYLYRVADAGDYTYSGKLRGDINSSGNSNFIVTWYLKYGKPGSLTSVNLGSFTNSSPGFVQWHFSVTSDTITLEKNDLIFLYAEVVISSIGGNMTSRCLIPDNGGSPLLDVPLTIIADTTYPATGAVTYLLHEALAHTVRCATDTQEGGFYSEWLGRTDIGYDADGGGSLRAVTSGNRLRMFDKPVYCSFSDLVNTCWALDGVGFGVERVDGVERVRCEPLVHWYQPKRMMRLTWVLDIEKEVLTDVYYNLVHGGSDKWANEKIRNLDEVNAKREWTLPITQLKNTMNIRPAYITSGYSIEFTRRESLQPSKDTRYDNDNFIIRLVRSGENFVPEKDEAFDTVTGVLSPETSYNLQDSPARCLRRHGRLLRAALHRQADQSIKFSFGEANTGMSSTLTSEGVAVDEDADITIGDLPTSLFLAEVYTVRAKLTLAQLQALEETDPDADANVWGFVEFAADDKTFKRGYLLEARLAGDSNEVVMKLLRANI